MQGDERPIRPAGQLLLRAFAGENVELLGDPNGDDEDDPHRRQVDCTSQAWQSLCICKLGQSFQQGLTFAWLVPGKASSSFAYSFLDDFSSS